MAELLSLEEAQARILERAAPLDVEQVALADACGRILAAAARALVDLPPFPSSAMDGFALRSEDTPGQLDVVDRIAAGRPADGRVKPGQAMAIATGGVVPDGADAVIPLEYVVEHDNNLEVGQSVAAGEHVRARGGDVRAGDAVVEAGARLSAAQVGALAAAGIAAVDVHRRPRAALLATGSELREPGLPLGPGQVYDANGVILSAALASAGAEVERLPVAADDEAEHRRAIERALEADVVVTSGGVSVGPHDLVRRIAGELGVEEVFWGVAVKPGKPLSFGVRGSTLVFGLPGNPVSSLVTFELFVRPAVLALQGAADARPRFELAELATTVRRNRERDELARARTRVDGDRVIVEPLGGQESHMIARAASADALVLVPRGDGELPAGATARYLRLA